MSVVSMPWTYVKNTEYGEVVIVANGVTDGYAQGRRERSSSALRTVARFDVGGRNVGSGSGIAPVREAEDQ